MRKNTQIRCGTLIGTK